MKYFILSIAITVFSCSGTLSEEQRKRIKESMEQGEIKKVSEAQITDAAFNYGRQVAAILEKLDSSLADNRLMDSLSVAFQVEIISLHPSNGNLRSVERQILEAYDEGNGTNDNVQKMGNDSILYTKPVVHKNPDGSILFQKALGIRMTRKQIVLSIKD